MGSVHRIGAPRLVEPFGVPEIFYSGIGAARLIGDGMIEIVLYRIATVVDCDRPPERRTVARCIRPIATIPTDTRLVLDAINRKRE